MDRALVAPRLALRPQAVLPLLDRRPTLVTLVLPLLFSHSAPPHVSRQAVTLMQACFKEIQKRFMISMPKFLVKVVDKNGTRVVDVSC